MKLKIHHSILLLSLFALLTQARAQSSYGSYSTYFCSDTLTPEELVSFEERALEKLNDFRDYIDLINNQTYAPELREQAVTQAQKLFQEDATLHFCDGRNKATLKVADYLKALSKGKWSHSALQIDDITIAQNLQPHEKHYTGTLTLTGTLHLNKPCDPTPIQVTFTVEKIGKTFGPEALKVWEVRLGTLE